MKRADWVFIGVAAAVAVAVWWLFIRPKATAAAAGTTKASANQSLSIGSNLPRDASDYAYGVYGLDWF
jgi:hypothetical protein